MQQLDFPAILQEISVQCWEFAGEILAPPQTPAEHFPVQSGGLVASCQGKEMEKYDQGQGKVYDGLGNDQVRNQGKMK